MGDKKLSGIGVEDIGKCAYGIFKKGESTIGKTIGIAGEHITCAQMAVELTNALGQQVNYNMVSPDMYRGFGFPGAEDLGNMFHYYQDFEAEFSDARDIVNAKQLNPSLQSFKEWLGANASRLPLD